MSDELKEKILYACRNYPCKRLEFDTINAVHMDVFQFYEPNNPERQVCAFKAKVMEEFFNSIPEKEADELVKFMLINSK